MTYRDPLPEVPQCPACGEHGSHAAGTDRAHAPFIHLDCPSGVTLYNGSTREWEDWRFVRDRYRRQREGGAQ